MPRKCSVCTNPHRQDIDKAIISGILIAMLRYNSGYREMRSHGTVNISLSWLLTHQIQGR